MDFVGHSVKAEFCLCTFFLFFFFFFLNHLIIDLGTKSCMQLALWHIKNLKSKNKQMKKENSNNSCKNSPSGIIRTLSHRHC